MAESVKAARLEGTGWLNDGGSSTSIDDGGGIDKGNETGSDSRFSCNSHPHSLVSLSLLSSVFSSTTRKTMLVQLFRRKPGSAVAVSAGVCFVLLLVFSLYWLTLPATVQRLNDKGVSSKTLINDIVNATLGVS